MSHTIIYNSEEQMIELHIHGDFFLKEAKEIIPELIRTVKAHDCFLWLTDLREATLKFTTNEIYDFPNLMATMLTASGLSIYKLKRVLVIRNDLKDYGFYETVTVNRAQPIKFFFDVDEARKWLRG